MNPGNHHAVQMGDIVEERWNLESGRIDEGTFTLDQLLARRQFQQLLHDPDPNPIFTRLGERRLKNVDPEELIRILDCFNRLFFPGAVMDFEFRWLSNPNTLGNSIRSLTPNGGRLIVKIGLNDYHHSYPLEYLPLNQRAMSRLNTLLHEVVHAYFQAYSCRQCQASLSAVEDTKGHGRAWQRVAALVERAASCVLGLPFKTNGFKAIWVHWSDLKYWPTREELEDWNMDG
ncbi:hypothetical protein BDW02DRAFT_601042 [Decorospora gaudefroyi]|uniref:SprT-like domain-containing protein n=1 Tax=Decorospora gaudefroyi TaxID=184978 RepID=A0A6A5K319_9PLEO|nr:hypothetical protein BDW02DRAFT_601042 [Decorospora gaudefroyi]